MNDAASSLEQIPDGETEATRDLVALQLRLMDDGKPPTRGQHAKAHGTVHAEFRAHDDLPGELRVGLFQTPRTYKAIARFSNGFGLDDREPDVHGVGLKLLDVCTQAPTDDGWDGTSQDFLMADHTVFFGSDVRKTVDFFSMKTDLTIQGLPPEELFPKLAAAFPKETALLLQFVRAADPSPLETIYWSQTAYAFGNRAAKYSLRPKPGNALGHPANNSPNFLRESLVEFLKTGKPAEFDFCIQLQRDPMSDPVEDPTVVWGGPEVPVATLTVPPQVFDTPELNRAGESLSFALWHALPEHRPLGGVNRAREVIYKMSAKRRSAGRSES